MRELELEVGVLVLQPALLTLQLRLAAGLVVRVREQDEQAAEEGYGQHADFCSSFMGSAPPITHREPAVSARLVEVSSTTKPDVSPGKGEQGES